MSAAVACAGSPALAPLPEPPVPWLLVGRRVRRALPAASGAGPQLREGVVIGVCTQPTGATLWRVHYEASSERDELSWPELSAALVNEAREASRQGLAPADTAPTPVVTPTPSAGDSGEPIELDASADDAGGEATSLQRSGRDPDADGPRAAAYHGQQPAPKYKGVYGIWKSLTGASRAEIYLTGGKREMLGTFASALDAAIAFDAAARRHGRRCVNFPRPGTDEVQAVAREHEGVTLMRAQRDPGTNAHNAAAGRGQQPAAKFKGVCYHRESKRKFHASLEFSGTKLYLGCFSSALDAAKAYDISARQHGRCAVNFPRPGTDELQAVWGETENTTLARAGRARMPSGNQHPEGLLPRAPLRKRPADAATEGGRPTALPSHPVPLWGSAAAESARAFKRQRTSDAAPGAAEDAVLLDAGHGPAELGRTPTAISYKGVSGETGKFIARLCIISRDHKIQLGKFVSAAGAACAYDAAVRQRGGVVVNFPRPGTDELQAVKGEPDAVTLRRAGRDCSMDATDAAAADSSWLSAANFRGVIYERARGVFRAQHAVSGRKIHLGAFASATEAAHAVDAAMRMHGRLVLNFPRPGTDEVQAVKGEADAVTLLRVGRAPATTPHAGVNQSHARPSGGAAATPAVTQPQQSAAAAAEAARAPRPAQPAPPPVVAEPASSSPESSFDAGLAPPPTFTPAPPAAPPGGELAAFLRGISPPLAGLDASLAAARSSGMTMAHLRCAAEKITQRPEFCKSTIDFLSQSLALSLAADQFALMLALQSLSSDDI